VNKIPNSFPITVFEHAGEKISDTITKKRCAIFYKGENRNGSYISDEFAEDLIKTLPYAPVKGIYDKDSEDYTDHGTKRSEGRIYGVVPENFNFAWEKRLDDDGVEREYACADVYLFTAIYTEAEEIAGKGQSMELYGPSIQGSWVDIGGKSLYKYSKASFLGLQVLGDNAVPCFEGASFFSLQDQQIYTMLTTLLEKIDQLSIGGNTQMENQNTLTFALSDNQKQNAIFKALNPEVVRYYVLDTYEDYALVFDFETEKYLKVSYSKDENDNITVAEDFVEVVAEYVTAEEKEALDQLRAKTESGTYEATNVEYNNNIQKISDLEVEVGNKTEELSTLNTEKEKLESSVSELNNTIENLNGQVSEYTTKVEQLQSFKDAIDKAEKEAVIEKFSAKLSAEIIEGFTAKIDSYTIQDLKKDLALALVENNDSIFTAEPNGNPGYVPKEDNVTGLEALLSKYKK
jgi:uncharacterized coiled-coil protein SlyX